THFTAEDAEERRGKRVTTAQRGAMVRSYCFSTSATLCVLCVEKKQKRSPRQNRPQLSNLPLHVALVGNIFTDYPPQAAREHAFSGDHEIGCRMRGGK